MRLFWAGFSFSKWMSHSKKIFMWINICLLGSFGAILEDLKCFEWILILNVDFERTYIKKRKWLFDCNTSTFRKLKLPMPADNQGNIKACSVQLKNYTRSFCEAFLSILMFLYWQNSAKCSWFSFASTPLWIFANWIAGIYPSTLTNIRLWKKIEFYKQKSNCETIVIAACNLGKIPGEVSGGKSPSCFGLLMSLRRLNSVQWPMFMFMA